jgi:hypothetical protein
MKGGAPASALARRPLTALAALLLAATLVLLAIAPQGGLSSRKGGVRCTQGGCGGEGAGGGAGAAGGSAAASRRAAANEAAGAGTYLVYVLLGDPHFQHYALHSIRQARLLNPSLRMVMVVSPEVLAGRPEWGPELGRLAVNVVNYTMLGSDFLAVFQRQYAGLWEALRRRVGFMLPTINDRMNFAFTQLTMERLYALYQLMHVYGLRDVIHVENDQMLYGDVAAAAAAAKACGVDLAMTRIGRRMAPAVVYARNASALKGMLDFMLEAISGGPDHATAVAGTGWVTDMSLTAAYFEQQRGAGRGGAVTSWPNRAEEGGGASGSACIYDKLGGTIFDAAPLGHWCCGTFERPTEYFTHRDGESEVAYWDREFTWVNATAAPAAAGAAAAVQGRPVRRPQWDGHPVFNLHIHSKQLHLWGSV